MQISYTTKEESKANQRQAFLKLKPAERFQRFLELMENISLFQLNEKNVVSNNTESKNFIIEKTCD